MSHIEEFSSSSSTSSTSTIMGPNGSADIKLDVKAGICSNTSANVNANANTITTSNTSSNNIKVVCRFRPQNSRELQEKGDLAVSLDEPCIGVTVQVRKEF